MKTKKIDKINLVAATNRPPLRYVASILLALLLCAGNAWATKISECELAQNAQDKSYPVPGVRYYVYATNPNTSSSYANEVVFWTCALTSSSYQIKQSAPINNTNNNGDVPADAVVVKIVVEENKPYIEADVDGSGTYKKLFFHKSSSSYLVAEKASSPAAAYTYYEPSWSFSFSNSTWQLSGKKYASTSATTLTDTKVCAKYRKPSGESTYCAFNASAVALATATNTTTVPTNTAWKFVKVPTTWYYSSTPSTSGYASATVQVHTDGTNWSSSIGETSTTNEKVHLYFKASAAPSTHDFLGWYDGNTLKSTNLEYDVEVSGTGTSGHPTTFNYVAKYSQKQEVFYKLQGVTETGQEERGSVHVSLNGTDWDEDGEIIGSIVTSAAKPQVTVYFKGVPSGDSYALSSFGYANVLSTISRVTKIGNSSFIFDSSTGITEAVFEIKSPSEYQTAETACLIDIKASFGKKAVYKGTVAKTTSSPANGCTVKVALTQDGLSSATTQTPVGSVALGEEETEKNRAIFFEASVDNTDPNRYRFNGWYSNAAKTEAVLSTNPSFNKGFAVQFGQTADQNTFTLYGDFSESTKKYYRAIAEASPNVATVKAAFTQDGLASASATANANEYNFNSSFERTAYFETGEPAAGYEFRGWSTASDGSGVIDDARNLTYIESFTVSSVNSVAPTTIKRYALFRAIDAQEVEMWKADNTSLGKGNFADAIATSNVAKIKLLRSVTLSNPVTITKPVTIDLDGFDINASTITVDPGADKAVTFINTDAYGMGKVYLNTEANGISITSGNLILDGANIKVIGSGENTYGIVVGSSAKLTHIRGTLRATALSTVYGVVVDGKAQLEGGTINASSTNSFAVQTNAGSETSISGSAELIGTVNALKQVGGTVSVTGGGFRGGSQDIAYADASKVMLYGGCFAHNTGLSSLISNPYVIVNRIPSGLKFSTSDYNYMVTDKDGSNYPLCTVISKKENTPTVRLNFNTLEAALEYAKNNIDDDREKTILLYENYELPEGNYTVPKFTTLVIPYSEDQTDALPHILRITTDSIPRRAYCTLRLKKGAHMDVYGAIEVGGRQTAGSPEATAISRPGGETYGLMIMEDSTSIALYKDAVFYAWGFVQGTGTIDVRRGATVKEQFQINDWKTIVPTCFMAKGTGSGGSPNYTLHVLPINQYFIQNVEVKATYRPGSHLLGQVCADLPFENEGLAVSFNDVGIIGTRYTKAEKDAYAAAHPGKKLLDDVAIFLMDNEADQENTWVRKSYDVAHDQQLYEVNNAAYLGSLSMYVDFTDNPTITKILAGLGFSGVKGLDVDSKDFVLALSNNFKIHLLSGNLTVTQNTVMLPGMVMEVNKKSTLTIAPYVWDDDKQDTIWTHQTLSLYDYHQWEQYAANGVDNEHHMHWAYGTHVKFRPNGTPDNSVRDVSTAAALGNAQLIVHGTVDVQGYLRTTIGDLDAFADVASEHITSFTVTPNNPVKDGGASIISTVADAGTIVYNWPAEAEKTSGFVYDDFLWQTNRFESLGEPDYEGRHVIPALLKNADGTFAHSQNTPVGKSFCFVNFDGNGGKWLSLTDEDCFVKDDTDPNHVIYYAKPKDYVALANGKTENADHTYSSADGTRTLILVDGCQWWEVERVAERLDLFHCTHPLNDMYYYWDGSKWTEKRYTVRWQDWDGDEYDTYSLKYGVHPEYLGTMPQRDKDAYYTYDFIGWAPEIADTTIVTGDVIYTAQYARHDVMYTVTWKDMAGSTIETGYYKLGDIPSCSSADMTDKEWNPAIAAVTGNTVYQLQEKNNVGPFDIKFMNWNGTQIGETQSVAKNAQPVAPAAPTKAALADIEFVFAGWRASDNQVYASNAIPVATANAIYTATFTEKPIKYEIIWRNENGAQLAKDSVTPNTVPQYNGTPVRSEDGEDYTFTGWNPAPVAATADAEYTATYVLKNRTVDGETYNVPAEHVALTTITITDDGKVAIPAGALLTANTLILEGGSEQSGQLDVANNDNNLIYVNNAYFDWAMNGTDGTQRRTWYAVAVPWEVNAETGISIANGRQLVIGRDFDLIYYNGAKRAEQGNVPACWEYVQWDVEGHDRNGNPRAIDNMLKPGRLYMMYFMQEGIQKVRFAKAAGASVIYTGTVTVNEYGDESTATTDVNWNGIANPRTYYASLGTGADFAQILKNGNVDDYHANGAENVYQTIDIDESRFIVGQPVFVQAVSEQAVEVIKKTSASIVNAAPGRRAAGINLPEEIEARYALHIAAAGADYSDNLFVQTAYDKADVYTIGQDLVKGGVAKSRAQLWVNRYDAKLSVNTAATVGKVYDFPLGIYVPASGEYTIELGITRGAAEDLYLTKNGRAIWNLSVGAYTASFEQGTSVSYGLRTKVNSPAVSTSIDEAVVDAQGATRKVLIDGQVYVIRNGEVYSVDGRIVK